jgi:hypothetical protein
MVKTTFSVLAAAAVTAVGLTPAVASAATHGGPTVIAKSSTSPSSGDPDTTVTFTVTTGALSLSAPTSADLATGGAPGTTISGSLGLVTVTDDRALLSAAWSTDASTSLAYWSTGTNTTFERIPASDVGYNPGTIVTTGTITATGSVLPPLTGLSTTPTLVVAGTAGSGNNSASWSPTISVAAPARPVLRPPR